MKRRAFTLPELLAVAAVGLVLACLLMVATTKERRTAQLNESLNNLKAIGSTMASYQADEQDLFPMFSWYGGEAPPANDVPADLVSQTVNGDDIAAASAQAVWLMRQIAEQPGLGLVDGWLPHPMHWWLPLAEYTQWNMTHGPIVSPADSNRIRWIRNPDAFLAGQVQPAPLNVELRWLYSSSYVPTLSLFSPDRGDAPNYSTMKFDGSHSRYRFTNVNMRRRLLGRRRASEIIFPSQKITITDRAQRHFGAERFVLYSDARAVALAGDGAASLRATASYSRGFSPATPSRRFPEIIYYEPEGWEPPPRQVWGEQVFGSVLLTRGGLQGRDFGGPEVDTSAWR